MSDEFPKIVRRTVTKVSPWVDLIARDVVFTAGADEQTYHAIGQQDYLAIVARTPDGRIALVRQFRPAVERVTWELPAGLVDAGESPEATCARELLEETGFPARTMHPLGSGSPCTGRLSNRIHSFFVETGERASDAEIESGVDVALRSPDEIFAMIRSGEFHQQLHIGALMLAVLHGHLKIAA